MLYIFFIFLNLALPLCMQDLNSLTRNGTEILGIPFLPVLMIHLIQHCVKFKMYPMGN